MITKEKFTELWNERIEPLFESGELTWKCSPRLEEYLQDVANWKYSDDEIMELVNSGKL
jgi:hypothetical protein